MRRLLLPLLVLLAGCAPPKALAPHPAESSAPDGCIWVARQDQSEPWHRSLYLCCAVPGSDPVCREAQWE